jgi:hypothetical protein
LARLAYFPFVADQLGSSFAVTEAALILATVAKKYRLVSGV